MKTDKKKLKAVNKKHLKKPAATMSAIAAAKLKIRLPHSNSSHKLQQRMKLNKQNKTIRVKGMPKGRPPKDQKKLVARQQLARQLQAARMANLKPHIRKRGRPPGSKNRPKPPLQTLESGESSENNKSNIVSGPVSPSVVKKQAKKQLSLPNGEHQCDSSSHSQQQVTERSGQISPPHISPKLTLPKEPPQPSLAEMRAFWRPPEESKPLLDKVLITDVTTNSTTITIRESVTDAGFFKHS